MQIIKQDKSGLTLLELLLSIAIIGIILIAFISLFTMSGKTNIKSESILKSTYIGQNVMEIIHSASKNIEFDEFNTNLEEELGDNFLLDATRENIFIYREEESLEKFVKIKMEREADMKNLIRVLVKVYDDKDLKTLEAQYETLYYWEEISSEE